jgi:hypothetical protein
VADKMFATIYVLCYGDHLDLHQRVMESLKKYAPLDEVKVVVWGNELSERCQQYLQAVVKTFPEHWYRAYEGNMPKYQVMHHLWHENPDTKPTTPWILWLDDDTYITAADWWEKTIGHIRLKYNENICYVGDHWYVHHLPGQEQFIKGAAWYKEQPWEMLPTRSRRVKKPGVTFATGSYVWLRTDVMRQLAWPDKRLIHNGGDTLLAEAIRQQGLPSHKFKYGVAVNKAKRRGRSDKPAGSKVNTRR